MVDLFRNAEKPSCGGPARGRGRRRRARRPRSSRSTSTCSATTPAVAAGLAPATLTVVRPARARHGRHRARPDSLSVRHRVHGDRLARVRRVHDRPRDCVEAERLRRGHTARVRVPATPARRDQCPRSPGARSTCPSAHRRASPRSSAWRRYAVDCASGQVLGAREAGRRRAPRSRPPWGRLALVVDELGVDRLPRSRGHPRRTGRRTPPASAGARRRTSR